MFAALKQNWKDFKAAPPGKRFQNIHKKRKDQGHGSAVRRWVLLILGVVLTLVGLFFMVAPGPGLIVVVPGLALIAGESLTVARFLDWFEVKLRPLYLWAKRRWQKADHGTKLALSSVAVLLGLAAAVTGYLIFSR